MMRFIYFILALSFPLTAFSAVSSSASYPTSEEQVLLDAIEKANSSYGSIKSDFRQLRTLKASGKTISLEGVLCYTRADKMSMRYSVPKTDLLIINPGKLYMNRGGKSSLFDTGKNARMKSLSSTLLDCVAGNPAKVADDNNADLSVLPSSDSYVVTISAKAGTSNKYSRIQLTYRKSDCVLVKMIMDEPSGVSNAYEMSSIEKNVSVADSEFVIPKH